MNYILFFPAFTGTRLRFIFSVMKTPIENSYWVVPGKILAGEYPEKTDRESLRRRLKALIEAGITAVIDLTEKEERLMPYEEELHELSGGRVRRYSFPVKDFSIPDSPDDMKKIVSAMEELTHENGIVYIHCLGGIGRTGTAAGCYLAEKFRETGEERAGEKALSRLAELWQECPKSRYHPRSPQTREQIDYIKNWKG